MLTGGGSPLAGVESPTVRMILDIATGTGGNRDQMGNDHADRVTALRFFPPNVCIPTG